MTTGPATSHTWSSLAAGTRYQAQARAINAEGLGPWSQSAYIDTDECAASTSTSCSLASDGTKKTGKINPHDTASDSDWYSAALTGGQQYRVEVDGRSTRPDVLSALGSGFTASDLLADPKLKIYNSSGTAIAGAEDNDSGTGLNAALSFTPGSTGTYYIEVTGHGTGAAGWFTVAVGTDAPPTLTSSTDVQLAENAALALQLTAQDPDAGHTIAGFAISGGPDMDKFTISTSNVLSMNTAPDYENPQDQGADNAYEVWIEVTSGPTGESSLLSHRGSGHDRGDRRGRAPCGSPQPADPHRGADRASRYLGSAGQQRPARHRLPDAGPRRRHRHHRLLCPPADGPPRTSKGWMRTPATRSVCAPATTRVPGRGRPGSKRTPTTAATAASTRARWPSERNCNSG